tara:strand:+ start:227 stop:433 length:207 start_codon:yes stop_codon:yes gene_type:complete
MKKNKSKKSIEGSKFHELVSKVTVEFYSKDIDTGEYSFQNIMPWIKNNRFLKIIQKKLNNQHKGDKDE